MITNILGILSFIADLTPILLLLYFAKVLKNKTFVFLFIFSFISVLFNIIVIYSDIKHYPLISYYAILVEAIFVSFLYLTFVTNKNLRLFILITTGIYLIYSIFYLSKIQSSGFSNWLATTGIIMTLLFSLFTFYNIILENKNQLVLGKSTIWLNFAYIFYDSGNLFLFATTDSLPNIFSNSGFWSIYIISNIFKNGFFLLAIFKEAKLKSLY